MSMQATLRLVDEMTERLDIDERRRSVRHPVSGSATALQSSITPEDNHKRICSIELLNLSDGGLGAVATDPMDLDSNISVIFSPHGPESGIHLHGRVVRCSATERGHEIGVQFHSRSAA